MAGWTSVVATKEEWNWISFSSSSHKHRDRTGISLQLTPVLVVEDEQPRAVLFHSQQLFPEKPYPSQFFVPWRLVYPDLPSASEAGAISFITHLLPSLVFGDSASTGGKDSDTSHSQTPDLIRPFFTDEHQSHPLRIPHHPALAHARDDVDGWFGESSSWIMDEAGERDVVRHETQSSERLEESSC